MTYVLVPPGATRTPNPLSFASHMMNAFAAGLASLIERSVSIVPVSPACPVSTFCPALDKIHAHADTRNRIGGYL